MALLGWVLVVGLQGCQGWFWQVNPAAAPDFGTDGAAIALTVSAAASLSDAVAALAEAYGDRQPQVTLTFNLAGSGTLQRQIQQGAAVDVFLSAAVPQMEALAAAGVLLPDTRRDWLQNQLVLAVPSGGTVAGWGDLADPTVTPIALGEPNSVPVGAYGRQVLMFLGLWETVQDRLVLTRDVRQALAYVVTGNAPAALVYATDAAAFPAVTAVAVAPPDSHDPIRYPMAAIATTPHPEAARALLDWLAGEEAIAIMERFGFQRVSPSGTVGDRRVQRPSGTPVEATRRSATG
jgi:molybdate transport system substrate-binding protein